MLAEASCTECSLTHDRVSLRLPVAVRHAEPHRQYGQRASAELATSSHRREFTPALLTHLAGV
jgi:hypothetical protein